MKRSAARAALAALLLACAAAADPGSRSSAEDLAGTLFSAAFNGPIGEAKRALKGGADVNARDKRGETALIYASAAGRVEIARLLLDQGAGLDIASDNGDTALIYTALNNRPDAARLLIQRGAAIDAKNSNGATALMIAASRGSTDTARVLLELGADRDAKNVHGGTALLLAILSSRPELARLLIESGADVNAKDGDGASPLIKAVVKNQSEIVALLIEKGAELEAPDGRGVTALAYAKSLGSLESAALLQNAIDARRPRPAAAPQPAPAPRVAQLESGPQFDWLLPAAGAAAGAVLLSGATLWLRRRKAAAERAARKRASVERIRALMRSDALAADEALREYEKEYRDLSDFPAGELLALYEARDRAKAADPEAEKRRVATEAKIAAEAALRATIDSDPRRAYEALREYLRAYGDCAAFSGAELGRLFERCGREGELSSGSLALNDVQLLGVAGHLSARGNHEPALRLATAEPLFSRLMKLDGAPEQMIAIHERAGGLPALFDGCGAKSHDFQLALARAFLALGRPADCLRVMTQVRVNHADDHAIVAAALSAEGRFDDAAKTLENVPKEGWSFVGWSGYLQFCLKTTREVEATEALEHVQLLRPLRRDPALHYALGLACEAGGRTDLAGKIFHDFAGNELPYKDAFERASRLPRPPLARWKAELEPAQDEGDRIGGRYELRSLIGHGSYGSVHAAYDGKAGKKIALKKVRPEIAGDAKERARFLHEAKLVSRLEHPAIVAVRDIVEERGEIYLVSEFVEGAPLAALLRQRKRLSLADCKSVLERVCSAVEHAHLRNVLHRDLKPGNIMIGTDGAARVLDFALARLDPSAPTPYMAPEQHRGASQRASDCYAIGVCLYEMSTGRPPFSGPEMLAQKDAKKYEPARALAPELPKELDRLLDSVFEPDPKERLADARELFQELKRL